jgi:hypothetical protein
VVRPCRDRDSHRPPPRRPGRRHLPLPPLSTTWAGTTTASAKTVCCHIRSKTAAATSTPPSPAHSAATRRTRRSSRRAEQHSDWPSLRPFAATDADPRCREPAAQPARGPHGKPWPRSGPGCSILPKSWSLRQTRRGSATARLPLYSDVLVRCPTATISFPDNTRSARPQSLHMTEPKSMWPRRSH